MGKLTNITAPQHRCTYGHCPAIYRSKDGKTFVVVGKYAPQHADAGDDEGVVEVPADLLLASLGVTELVKSIQALGTMPDGYCFCFGHERNPNKPDHLHTGECWDLRSALKAVQGGDGNG